MLTFSGHELVVGGHGWNAEHPVLAALLVEGVVCVILDFMTFPCGQQAANLRGGGSIPDETPGRQAGARAWYSYSRRSRGTAAAAIAV